MTQNKSRRKEIDIAVEAICNKGCKQVHLDILQIETAKSIPKELAILNNHEQQLVLKELKEIMATYGDNCRL